MISPELQETAIRDHCARNGYDLVEVITDLDLSGRFWKRRKVERVIEMIERRDVEVIVVWKMSRVARNRLDWSIALDRVESVGGRLESATEPIDTSTSSGRFSRGILAELAAFESERAGEQWQETIRRRWKQGRPHSGRPRFGYRYDREHGYTPDPYTAPILRELYARSTAGEGARRLAAWAATLDVGAPATGHGISYMLRAGFAAGYLEHHDPDCTRTHRSGVRCPNVIRERGSHEPIITDGEFAAFEAATAARATLPARLVSPVSTLSGVMRCSSCGLRMSRKSARGEKPYFRCVTDRCPAPTSFREERAEQLLLEWLPTVAAAVDARARQLGPGTATAAVEADRLARVVAAAERSLEKLTIDYARGAIPDSAYAAARDALVQERDTAAAAHAGLARAAASIAVSGHVATELLTAWDDMTPEQRNRIVRELCTIQVSRTEKRPVAVVRGLWE